MKIPWIIPALTLSVLVMPSLAEQQPARQAIALPAAAKAIIRAQMNGHLVSLDTVATSLARGDYDSAASAAREMSVPRGQDQGADPASGPGLGVGQHLPEGFRTLGRGFHGAAAEFARSLSNAKDAPESVQPGALFAGLAKITNTCVSCHDAYTFE